MSRLGRSRVAYVVVVVAPLRVLRGFSGFWFLQFYIQKIKFQNLIAWTQTPIYPLKTRKDYFLTS